MKLLYCRFVNSCEKAEYVGQTAATLCHTAFHFKKTLSVLWLRRFYLKSGSIWLLGHPKPNGLHTVCSTIFGSNLRILSFCIQLIYLLRNKVILGHHQISEGALVQNCRPAVDHERIVGKVISNAEHFSTNWNRRSENVWLEIGRSKLCQFRR